MTWSDVSISGKIKERGTTSRYETLLATFSIDSRK